jgi:hypothetical protein
MSSSLSCRCGVLMVSNGVTWSCPLVDQFPENHDYPVADKRVGLFQEIGDFVPMILRSMRRGKPGPVGAHGSRLKRQPWNQGKRKNGARIQAKRAPSRREQSLAAEWYVFIQSRMAGVKRFETGRKTHHER